MDCRTTDQQPTTKPKRVRRSFLSDSTKKHRKLVRDREYARKRREAEALSKQSVVNIWGQIIRWHDFKTSNRIVDDEQAAQVLLDHFESWQSEMEAVSLSTPSSPDITALTPSQSEDTALANHTVTSINHKTKRRYIKAHQVFQESETSSDVSVTKSTRSSNPCTLSRMEKLRITSVVTQKLASLISDCEMPDFTQRMHVLQQLLGTWEAGTSDVGVVFKPTDHNIHQYGDHHINQCGNHPIHQCEDHHSHLCYIIEEADSDSVVSENANSSDSNSDTESSNTNGII